MSGQYMRAEYSLFSEEFAGESAINWNDHHGRSGGMFPFIVSVPSVFSVAMKTNQDYPVYYTLLRPGLEQAVH
ncbi:MAG: hypothetical protein ACLFVO_10725 [Chloroflexaceae bacterium]